MTEFSYLLGDLPPEAERLANQHRAWLEVTLRSLRNAGLKRGQRVLDVGAGPGLVSREMAFEVGREGSVVAVEQSGTFVATLRTLAAEQSQIDVIASRLEDLDVRDESFDLIYARWVFCFLADPAPIIATLRRALKPGGRLLILDYFNYRAFSLAPASSAMAEVVCAIRQSWQDSAGSLDVAGTLPTLLEAAGMSLDSMEPTTTLARPGDPLWHWPREFLQAYLPTLIAKGYLEKQLVEQFWQDWLERESTPGSFLFLPPVLEIMARR